MANAGGGGGLDIFGRPRPRLPPFFFFGRPGFLIGEKKDVIFCLLLPFSSVSLGLLIVLRVRAMMMMMKVVVGRFSTSSLICDDVRDENKRRGMPMDFYVAPSRKPT